MSDPLSIAAGVVGVVTAAAQISLLLTKFTKSTIAAPQQAKVVLAEVSDISVILTQLQSYLLGLESPNSSRACLLKVEKVVTIVSGCVLTFSELEKLLDELKTEGLDVLDCLKWARKESAIIGLVQRLQNNKSSLSVILNILNAHTITEANDSVDRLHHLVAQGYSEISSRLRALEVRSLQNDNPSWTSKDDTESIATIRAHRPDLSAEEIMESGRERFDFSDELRRSRVYKRNEAFRTSVISVFTNSVYSLGWSFFSDLSMAEVSNISVINLAVIEGEVFNPGRSSQTWSAQSNQGVSTDDQLDGRNTQLYKVGHGPVQADTSAVIARGHWPASTQTQQRRLPRTRSPLPRLHPLERRKIRPSRCSICNIRTEDLVYLTEDLAFCAICRHCSCQHCKKKIENFRFVRTAQAISCMECYVDRRYRKKAAVINAYTEQTTPMSPTKVQNQGMPALPLEATWELRYKISKAASASSDPNTPTSTSNEYPSVFYY